ncbi:MAG: hypothetical protein HY762_09755 [Planctomycetes bacterium]|nr:hypothetical protein [Planctomycetota bacterium]
MKKMFITLSLAIVICTTITYTEEHKEPAWKEYKMTYSTDWDILKNIATIIPKTGEIITNTYIALPNPKDNQGFISSAAGRVAKFDVDGDGTPEKEVKTKEDFVDYKITYDKSTTLYRLRVWLATIMFDKTVVYNWYYQRGGFWKGKVAGESVILIDDNNNGSYNDYGQDALVIGNSKQANLLSQMVSIKGKFYEVEIETSGEKIKLKEYTGLTGQVDVKNGWKHDKLKPDKVILQQMDNDIYLDIPLQPKTFAIPVGKYKLFYASLGKRIKVKGGDKYLPVVEDKDITSTLKWGMPFNLLANPNCTKGGSVTETIAESSVAAPAQAEPEPTPPSSPPPARPDGSPNPAALTSGPTPEGLEALRKLAEKTGDKRIIEKLDKISPPPPAAPPPQKPKGGAELRQERTLECPFITISELPSIYGNKTGNLSLEKWQQRKTTNSPAQWGPYHCPISDYRGLVTVKVSLQSQIFGDLSYEYDIEVIF